MKIRNLILSLIAIVISSLSLCSSQALYSFNDDLTDNSGNRQENYIVNFVGFTAKYAGSISNHLDQAYLKQLLFGFSNSEILNDEMYDTNNIYLVKYILKLYLEESKKVEMHNVAKELKNFEVQIIRIA
ncbi:MAG: hypothetical protein RBT61_04310 [Candidatus Kapabacteria bacterium]|jgi:hypothetical protein|nr:hypothetical protein [Candidatus Kapabacteria bacterium]